MADQPQATKRPKCKVVRNMHEKHNGLARVAPKGCRIGKRVLTKGGPIRKVNKQGALKPKKKKYKVAGDSFEVRADMPDGTKDWFVWDTGAMSTSANQTVGIKLGLIDTDGKPTGKYKHGKVVVQTADNKQHDALIFAQVPLRIREANVTSSGDIVVKKRGALLYGVSHIRGVRKHMKVKFVGD